MESYQAVKGNMGSYPAIRGDDVGKVTCKARFVPLLETGLQTGCKIHSIQSSHVLSSKAIFPFSHFE